jgi:hypothetical protein
MTNGRDAAVEAGVAVEVARGVVRKDRLQVRGLLLGGEELRAAHVGDAAHADVAVAPGLLGNPLDGVVEVLLLLIAEEVVVALGIVAAADVHDDVRVTARHPELGDAALVLAERDHAALELARVDRARHQRGEFRAPRRGPDHVRGELHAVAHRNARFVVGDARVAWRGLLRRHGRRVERVLRRDERIDAADTFRINLHASFSLQKKSPPLQGEG